MTILKIPVKITLTAELSDGTVETRTLTPGENLTDDGVRIETDVEIVERRDGTTTTLTSYAITWTEIE